MMANTIRRPLLDSLPEAVQETLLHGATRAHFAEDELLCHTGEPANVYYLIESGRVSIEMNDPQSGRYVVEVVGAGDPVGWSWMFEPFEWRFDARALEPVDALRIDAGHLLSVCESDPTIGYPLMKRIAQIVVRRLMSARRRIALDRIEGARED